jgi:hypothetical protein
MKYFVLISCLCLALSGCQITNTPTVNANILAESAANKTNSHNQNSISNDLSKSVDGVSLSPEVEEILENAEEFQILSYVESDKKAKYFERFYVWGYPVFGNRLTKLADMNTRQKLLNAFYEDIKNGGAVAGCFHPHHTIKAKYRGKYVVIAICHSCGKFHGIVSSKGFDDPKGMYFYRPISSGSFSKSLPIFEEIIKKK